MGTRVFLARSQNGKCNGAKIARKKNSADWRYPKVGRCRGSVADRKTLHSTVHLHLVLTANQWLRSRLKGEKGKTPDNPHLFHNISLKVEWGGPTNIVCA